MSRRYRKEVINLIIRGNVLPFIGYPVYKSFQFMLSIILRERVGFS